MDSVDYLYSGYALIRFRAIQSATRSTAADSAYHAALGVILAILLKYATLSFDLAAAVEPIGLRTQLTFYFHFISEHTLLIGLISFHVYFVLRMNGTLRSSLAFLATLEMEAADEQAKFQARRRAAARRRWV